MTARQRVDACEGGDVTPDNSCRIAELRAELARVVGELVGGKVANRAGLAVRAKELHDAIRRLEGAP